MKRNKVLLWALGVALLTGIVLQVDLIAPAAGTTDAPEVAFVVAESAIVPADGGQAASDIIPASELLETAPDRGSSADHRRAVETEASTPIDFGPRRIFAVLGVIALLAVILLHRGSS